MSQIMRSHGGGKAIGIIVLLLILIIIVALFIGVAYASSTGDRILKGVYINNTVDVGDKTKEQAKDVLADYQAQLGMKPYTLRFDDKSISFYGKDIEVGISDNVIDEAFQVGKSGNIFEKGLAAIKSFLGAKNNVNAEIYYNERALMDKASDLIGTDGTAPVDSSYEIKDTVIEISKGHDGIKAKYDSLRSEIQDSLLDVTEPLDITIEADIARAKEVDIDELYNKVYVEKKDASIDKEGNYTKEQVGVSFDKAVALKEYRELPYDSKMTIELKREEPEITSKNLETVLFADKLGEYSTKYNAANTNRSTNLALAANNINGKIFLPGEEFSYNKEVGERTTARGFKEAHIFSGGKVEDGLGGGICQISSTLYCATLIADLEITERKNHQMYPEYVEPSLDATVAWGSVDFKFKNNRKTPIKIEASAKGGTAKVIIWGKKEEDEPTITLKSVTLATYAPSTVREADNTMLEGQEKVKQTAVNGYKSEGYKIYTDIKGKEIKRVKVSTDEYRATNKIIAYGTKKASTTTVEQPAETTSPIAEPTTPVEEPITGEPIQEPIQEPISTTTPTEDEKKTTTPSDPSSGWPTGWDTPENPNFKG